MDGPPEARWTELVAEMLAEPGERYPAGDPRALQAFNANSMKFNKGIVVMLSGGRLVLRLPGKRVDGLVAEGAGERFDPGAGRVMPEWFAVFPGADVSWSDLAREAMAFVATLK